MQKNILFLSCLLAATAQAAPNFPGLRTQMGDWDTVCDNTGTCRVAGYHNDDSDNDISFLFTRPDGKCDNTGTCHVAGYHNDRSDNAVSVLFTRPAGKNAATTAQIQIIEECETPAACAQADNTGGELFLNGQSLGTVAFGKDDYTATLSPKQTEQLIAAFAEHQPLSISDRQGKVWIIPDNAFDQEWLAEGKFWVTSVQSFDFPHDHDETNKKNALKNQTVGLFANGSKITDILIDEDFTLATIPEGGRAAVEAVLATANRVTLRIGGKERELSDDGAYAALLAADAYQGRVGDGSAWVKNGATRFAAQSPAVLPPKAALKIQAARVPAETKGREYAAGTPEYRKLWKLIRKPYQAGECTILQDSKRNRSITVYPLSGGKMLIETGCELFAYNSNGFFAIADSKFNRLYTVLEDSSLGGYGGFDVDKTGTATLSGNQKGRGLGDCWSTVEYVWDGKAFIRSKSESDTQCKGFAGGAWEQPDFVADVLAPK